MKYDLAVCLRVYPVLATSDEPMFPFKDKLELITMSLNTLRSSFGGLKVKLTVLLNDCPPGYPTLLNAIFANVDKEFIVLQGRTNQQTFHRQLEVLTNQTDADLVYFAEDDYLYLPSALEQAVSFMQIQRDINFVTLFDHLDHYTKQTHRIHPEVIWNGNIQWRTVSSTCLTFMARRSALQDCGAVFKTYNKNSDLGMWLALIKQPTSPWSWLRSIRDGLFFTASHFLAWRYAYKQILFGREWKLWCPKPGLATHMNKSTVAPGVDWNNISAIKDK